MKKTLFLIGICTVLISMPAISAFSTTGTKLINENILEKDLLSPTEPDYDGTFIGALGRVWKENGEWQNDASAYIAGVYRDRNYKILYGKIFNLDEEQVGKITMISSRIFLIGRIENMEGKKAPIVGFLIDVEEDYFIGRLMSLFGPTPHMWGQYTPNE
jgi:hypothetical protein